MTTPLTIVPLVSPPLIPSPQPSLITFHFILSIPPPPTSLCTSPRFASFQHMFHETLYMNNMVNWLVCCTGELVYVCDCTDCSVYVCVCVWLLQRSLPMCLVFPRLGEVPPSSQLLSRWLYLSRVEGMGEGRQEGSCWSSTWSPWPR